MCRKTDLVALHTVATVFRVSVKPSWRYDRVIPEPSWERRRGVVREQFSVRLTAGQLLAIMRTRARASVATRVRFLIRASLDGAIWPKFVDGAVDEGADAWVQFRLSPELRAEIYEYQQAVGCLDLSAAVRSLVTSALAVEGGDGAD